MFMTMSQSPNRNGLIAVLVGGYFCNLIFEGRSQRLGPCNGNAAFVHMPTLRMPTLHMTQWPSYSVKARWDPVRSASQTHQQRLSS